MSFQDVVVGTIPVQQCVAEDGEDRQVPGCLKAQCVHTAYIRTHKSSGIQ